MEQKTKQIDPYLVKLSQFPFFLAQFYLRCSDYDTQEKAYEAVERAYVSVFGKRRYSDFESFRQVRNRYLKNKKAEM